MEEAVLLQVVMLQLLLLVGRLDRWEGWRNIDRGFMVEVDIYINCCLLLLLLLLLLAVNSREGQQLQYPGSKCLLSAH